MNVDSVSVGNVTDNGDFDGSDLNSDIVVMVMLMIMVRVIVIKTMVCGGVICSGDKGNKEGCDGGESDYDDGVYGFSW